MQSTATLVDVQVLEDGSIFVTLPDGYGKSYTDRQSLVEDVERRLQGATDSMIWLLINDWLVNNTPSGTCLLNTDDVNGNWVKRL